MRRYAGCIVAILVGCGGEMPPPPDVVDDEGWPVPETCPVSTPLEIEIGEGVSHFEAIAADGPVAEYGPQGGQHVILAVRINNPSEPHGYEIAANVSLAAEACDSEACDSWTSVGHRTARIWKPPAMQMAEDGSVSVVGLLVVVESWSPNGPRKIDFDVKDACGRQGTQTMMLPALN